MVNIDEFKHAGGMLLRVAELMESGMDFGEAMNQAKNEFGRFKLHNKKSYILMKKVLL